MEEFDRVPAQYFKKILSTDDLWEVRVKVGSNIFRFIGFLDEPNLLVLAHAFRKKTQKTPRQAIKLAKERKHEYFMRRRK